MKTKDILLIAIPVAIAGGTYLYFKSKNVAVVYFNSKDFSSAQLLASALQYKGYIVQIIYLYPTMTPQQVQEIINKYSTVYLLGGEHIDPLYNYYYTMGMLPAPTQTQYVIKQIGKYIFIAGWEAPDTYNAVLYYVTKVLNVPIAV